MPPLSSQTVRDIAKEVAEATVNKRVLAYTRTAIGLLLVNIVGMGKIILQLQSAGTDRFTGTMADKSEDWRGALNPSYVKVDIRKIQRETPVN